MYLHFVVTCEADVRQHTSLVGPNQASPVAEGGCYEHTEAEDGG